MKRDISTKLSEKQREDCVSQPGNTVKNIDTPCWITKAIQVKNKENNKLMWLMGFFKKAARKDCSNQSQYQNCSALSHISHKVV